MRKPNYFFFPYKDLVRIYFNNKPDIQSFYTKAGERDDRKKSWK